MSHYIKNRSLLDTSGSHACLPPKLIFFPLKPSSISCCVSVPSAEMSTAPPNHRRGKPGGTAYLHFGLSLTTIQTLDSQNLQRLSFFFFSPQRSHSHQARGQHGRRDRTHLPDPWPVPERRDGHPRGADQWAAGRDL